jgi:hypothetical protein
MTSQNSVAAAVLLMVKVPRCGVDAGPTACAA